MKCPSCASGNIAFDWDGVTSINIKDGKVASVSHGGVTGVGPDRLQCFDCGLLFKLAQSDPATEGLDELLDTLPAWLGDRLADGFDSFRLEERDG